MDYNVQLIKDQMNYGKIPPTEDGVAKVSSDGESHEMLTMIAAGSGCIVAAIVLFILIHVLDCKFNSQRPKPSQMSQSSVSPIQEQQKIFTIFATRKSVDFNTTDSKCDKNCPRLNSVTNLQQPIELEGKQYFSEIILKHKLPNEICI